MNKNRKRRPSKIEYHPLSFGGWGEYELWVEHGFTPKPKSEPAAASPDPGTNGAEAGTAATAVLAGPPETPAAEPPEPSEPSWPAAESPAREPLGMREPLRPRPYVRGTRPPRPGPRHPLLPEVMLTTTGRHRTTTGLDPDLVAVCRMCQIPTSVAEVAAYLMRPLDVTRPLVLQGIRDGLLLARGTDLGRTDRPPLELLHRVHAGLLRLG
ncbi:DUF742 domain-containing protein [Amycolatopsis sp. NBC_01307]|uniref:DUF742 domain-containing protein n=1 Tax=Amycolatopsis sp. NBC_01307 TaxID=2903561 RepID=UPI002E136841|nr:DUF742 domain-containing protein [Amycolatopsis sp. NBC_01307]